MVIDFGTATTYDMVDEKRYLHGRNHSTGHTYLSQRHSGRCGKSFPEIEIKNA